MVERRPDPSRAVRLLGVLGGVVLGAVFLLAAWGKALDPVAFAEEIRTQGLDLLLSAPHWAVLLVAVEAALGLALLLGLRGRWVLGPTSALVALFLFLNARAYWRFSRGLIDAGDACGCFGALFDRTPAEAFWQDLLLLVPPLVLCWLPLAAATPRAVPKGRWSAVALTAIGAGVFAHLAPDLPLDDLATRLKPGVRIGDLCAGSDGEGSVRICLDALAPEMEEGEHFVVLAPLGAPALEARVDDLSGFAASRGAPKVWLLTASGEVEQSAFFWRFGPAFEIREVPEALLAPLYRSPPRSFVVLDGAVVRTFAGIPPLETDGAGEASPE